MQLYVEETEKLLGQNAAKIIAQKIDEAIVKMDRHGLCFPLVHPNLKRSAHWLRKMLIGPK